MKKVPDPDPAGQKSTDPTESGSSSLVISTKLDFENLPNCKQKKRKFNSSC